MPEKAFISVWNATRQMGDNIESTVVRCGDVQPLMAIGDFQNNARQAAPLD